MATFHIRKQGSGYSWALVSDDDRIMAMAPATLSTRGEAVAAVSVVRRELAAAEIQIDTTVAASRWRGIDMVTGEALSGPAPEPEETHDEGETGPPVVDLDDELTMRATAAPDQPKDAA